MSAFLHSSTSVVHLVGVGLALATGTLVVLRPKNTPRHRALGCLYVGSMAVVLLTAFRMYFLFGRLGVVHYGAMGRTLALGVGTGAVLCRPVLATWRQWHYLGMGASVTGLYAALVVESTYRFFPASYFWWVTLGPASVVFLCGALVLRKHFPAGPRRQATARTVEWAATRRVSRRDVSAL